MKRVLWLLLSALAAWPASAQRDPDHLVVGARAPIVSLDPAMSGLGSMHGYYRHIYDALVFRDPKSQPVPGLAESWRVVDPLTWEFRLRHGVLCHDGSPLDAADVAATLRRLPTVAGSDLLTVSKMRPVAELQVVDPHTVRFRTREPYPGLLAALPELHIVCDSVPADAATEDFNAGRAAIGSGPYRHAAWERGARWELQRNDAWWGERPDFGRVSIREITSDASRMAALEAGDVDLADYVPPMHVARFAANERLEVFRAPSSRTIFLQFESIREQTPFATDRAGQPLPRNPFRDPKVRRALALGVNGDAIVARTMEGLAVRATQGVPEGFPGFDPGIAAPRYAPDEARKLLAEAGFPNGFRLALHCSNNRYVNDGAICQAAAQMLARIGVETSVEMLPTSIFFPRLIRREFSAHLLGWGNASGDAATFLRDVMASRDQAQGLGSWNMATADPELDRMVVEGTADMDLERRAASMAKAMRLVAERDYVLPLHAQLVVAATRRGLAYTPQADESTLAIAVRRR
jgi:peptide/nickel transport system substrate-binding protein